MSNAVIPAKAGIQCMLFDQGTKDMVNNKFRIWLVGFGRTSSARHEQPSIIDIIR
jgi:hypothetical protein